MWNHKSFSETNLIGDGNIDGWLIGWVRTLVGIFMMIIKGKLYNLWILNGSIINLAWKLSENIKFQWVDLCVYECVDMTI